MYVTVGEERNQTWIPRERPVKGWLFRMFLNYIGSRGFCGGMVRLDQMGIFARDGWSKYFQLRSDSHTIADIDIDSDTRVHFI